MEPDEGEWWNPLLRFAVHLVVAVMSTAPLAWRMGDRLPLGAEPVATVPLFNLWSLRWTAQELPAGWNGWWDAPIFWPTTGAYARSELQPLTGLAYGALRWLTNDTAAYGVLLIAALALTGLAASAVARQLGVAAVPAVLAGILAQTIPFLFDQLGVLQLLMVWPVLLAVNSLLAWAQTPSLRRAAAFGCWLSVSYLTCGYHAALFVMATVLATPCLVRRTWLGEWRCRSCGVALAAGVFAACAIPFAFGQSSRLGDARWADATIAAGSASWQELWPGGAWYGGTLVVLATVGGVTARGRRAVLFLAVLGVAAFGLALGTRLSILGWHPYAMLVEQLGFVARLRSPFRATALGQLVLVLLSSLALDRVWRTRVRLQRGAVVGVVVAVLLTAELGSGRLAAMPPTDLVWIQWLAEHPGGAVVMMPMAPGSRVEDFEATTEGMVQALEHGHPLVNGYTGFFPSGHRGQRQRLEGFPDASSVAELRALGVEYVVADALWWNSRRAVAAVTQGLTIVLAGPDGVLIRIAQP